MARFFETLEEDLHNNSKSFWSLFKPKTKDSSVPRRVSMGVGGSDPTSVQSVSCPRDIVEFFNVYFSSVLNGNDDPIYSITPPSTTGCESTLSELKLCLEDVLNVLLNHDTNKATGPDGILPRLLKETAHQIAPSLCSLSNQSFNGGSLPEDWKLANIIPVFKKGDKTHVENYIVRFHSSASYRKSSSAACMLSKLRDHLLELINTSQQGFIPSRSCTTSLVPRLFSN
jgi:hypothetical protein